MNILRAVIIIILFFALLILAVLNSKESVSLDLYWRTIPDIPLIFIIFASLLVGVIIAGIIGLAENMRLRLTQRRLRQEIKRLEEEVNSLRHLPIAEGIEREKENFNQPNRLTEDF